MTELFDKNGNATETHIVKVSGYDSATGELTATYDVRILAGTGIPSCSTMAIAPTANDGYVVCWDGSTWNQVEDLRGKIAYTKSDLTKETVRTLGPLDDAYTLLEPATPYDIWDGEKWVTDTDTQHSADVAAAVQKKNSLRAVADAEISWLQDAVDAEIATDEETALLAAWKTYRVQLMRVDTSKAPDIEWPTPPVE
ncbi:tail fiber assembly protein [Kluyvera sichuanensis]|uniref:tail fiber assembly protein n=1 Tax=Kluyvera sichuanensis TaxID=2725494 RepID=UPI0034A163EB